jgi:hypothetical protein
MALLHKDQTLAATAVIRASPQQVYSVVSDVTRVGSWSPEAKRAEWISTARFCTWNRRRHAIWRTEARVVDARPGTRFSFVVEVFGKDWTQWTYIMDPLPDGSTQLTEKFQMRMALPLSVLLFERAFMFIWDRP